MSLPVPLGVRLHSIINSGEQWVTRFVDDITYRSVVPGGFASATITLRLPRGTGTLANPDPVGFSRLTELFGRVQVVDLRSGEIAWEGRIEDPARQTDPDTWQIGALGSMVTASDVTRSVFYVDSSMDRWQSADMITDSGQFLYNLFNWQTEKDDDKNTLKTTYNVGYTIFANPQDYSWRWDSHGFDQAIARFTTTHLGSGPNTTQEPNMRVMVGIDANATIDLTTFGSESTKTNVLGTDYTDQNARFVIVGAEKSSGSGYKLISTDLMILQVRNPKVIGMRRDRFGNKLVTASNYTTDYVTVAQVVEDVVGRFLVAGWLESSLNVPWPGSVRGQDCFIDATDTTQILHLAYPDGATAADILNDLAAKVQTDAYWALWESKWTAEFPDDYPDASGFRFEWASWPANWGYLASSQDGFEGQPNGDATYNFISYRYPDSDDGNQPHVLTGWHGNEMAPELLAGGFTRAVLVNKDDPTDASTAGALRNAYLNGAKKVLNAGTLTVRRPVQFYDTGSNGWSGAGRMVDPHMIRPGKLVRITDLPPRAHERDMSFGNTAPADSLDGTVFRVVATEYGSRDNSCRMELDQVARWQVPTQISSAAGDGSKTIRIQ